MRKLLLLLCFVWSLVLSAQPSPSEDLNLFQSLYGTTGAVRTPNAYTVGKFQGNIGVFENFKTDEEDRLTFNFGVHENIEVGIQSDIPTQPEPKMNFLFKISANRQGEYLGLKNKWIPVTAFGINRNNAFAVISYDFKPFQLSVGYNFSDGRQALFSNMNISIKKIGAFQLEYLDKILSAGFRAKYKGVVLSILYSHSLITNTFDVQKAYWEVSYNF